MANPIGSALRPLAALIDASLDVPVRMIGPLGRTLAHVEALVAGVGAIHEQFIGLRQDIAALDEHVQGLRGEVRGMTGAVGGIKAATDRLDERVVELAVKLEGLDALAGRIGRFGLRRRPPEPS